MDAHWLGQLFRKMMVVLKKVDFHWLWGEIQISQSADYVHFSSFFKLNIQLSTTNRHPIPPVSNWILSWRQYPPLSHFQYCLHLAWSAVLALAYKNFAKKLKLLEQFFRHFWKRFHSWCFDTTGSKYLKTTHVTFLTILFYMGVPQGNVFGQLPFVFSKVFKYLKPE